MSAARPSAPATDRRAFLLALGAAPGCSPNEAPTKPAPLQHGAPTGAAASGVTGPPAASPAGAKTPRVAMLFFSPRGITAATVTGSASVSSLFRSRLAELGWRDGDNIRIEEGYAEGDAQKLTRLAQEIVAGKPDVIVTIAAAATVAARKETDSVPIVMAHAGSPVEAGLVASLARPGGNVTGTTSLAPELGGKQVELLRQLMPSLARLGVLANPNNIGTRPLLENLRDAARRSAVGVVVAEVTQAEEFDKAFDQLRSARLDALFVMVEPLIGSNRERITAFAAANRLPTSYDVGRTFVREGGLISYGPLLATHYARVAEYVDKILKGAKPGELPVQQPTEFALVINLKTARSLGLSVPQSLLLRADEVIQ